MSENRTCETKPKGVCGVSFYRQEYCPPCFHYKSCEVVKTNPAPTDARAQDIYSDKPEPEVEAIGYWTPVGSERKTFVLKDGRLMADNEPESKPTPPIKGTVLTYLELTDLIYKESGKWIGEFDFNQQVNLIAYKQDAHTRRKLIELGWKSKEEVTTMLAIHGSEMSKVTRHGIAKKLKKDIDSNSVYFSHDGVPTLREYIKELEEA